MDFPLLNDHLVTLAGGDVLTVFDKRGNVEYISPSVERVLGYDPGDLVGENLFDYLHPDSREHAMEAFFECADESLVIAAGTDSLWSDLCDAIDRPELYDDDRFGSVEARLENREALVAELSSTLESRSRETWIERLHGHNVPAGPIYDTVSVWEDEHVQKRDLHRRMEREGREAADVIDHPIHFANLTTSLETPPQELGESTDDVLERCGYSESEIERLREERVVE